MKKSNQITLLAYSILAALFLSGCADVSPNVSECVTSNPYGFWFGLWHGIIIPYSFIGSLFSENIAIYAYNNNGVYDFGFVIGSGSLNAGLKVIRKAIS